VTQVNAGRRLSELLIYGSILIIAVTVLGVLGVFVARYLKKRYFSGEEQGEKPPFSLNQLKDMERKELITSGEHRTLRQRISKTIVGNAGGGKQKDRDGPKGVF
jgi:hypothetical protein